MRMRTNERDSDIAVNVCFSAEWVSRHKIGRKQVERKMTSHLNKFTCIYACTHVKV